MRHLVRPCDCSLPINRIQPRRSDVQGALCPAIFHSFSRSSGEYPLPGTRSCCAAQGSLYFQGIRWLAVSKYRFAQTEPRVARGDPGQSPDFWSGQLRKHSPQLLLNIPVATKLEIRPPTPTQFHPSQRPQPAGERLNGPRPRFSWTEPQFQMSHCL